MASYPDYPDNRLIINGVDITTTYGLVLIDGYTLEPPSPKTYTVDIPGGNGVIDLTEAFTKDVAYNNRSQTFTFDLIYPEEGFETVKTKVSNFLHGRAYDYQMTMDPDYTYHGRFTVNSYSHSAYANGILGVIEIQIDADPYKKKETATYKLNATGGKMYRLESGRRPVHPTIQCDSVCFVTWDGEEYTIPAGTYRLNEVTFQSGYNELYINSLKLTLETWDDIGESGKDAMAWDTATKYRWDDIQRLGLTDSAPQSWEELQSNRWEEFNETGTTPKRWSELDYRHTTVSDTTVYLTYDWEDL
jgi:phage-related protein